MLADDASAFTAANSSNSEACIANAETEHVRLECDEAGLQLFASEDAAVGAAATGEAAVTDDTTVAADTENV